MAERRLRLDVNTSDGTARNLNMNLGTEGIETAGRSSQFFPPAWIFRQERLSNRLAGGREPTAGKKGSGG
jgi:hypothetical protein